ncbi:Unknown protein, partial [Striga hermonthica]
PITTRQHLPDSWAGHHKAMNKVKDILRALSRPDSDDYYSGEFHKHKWLQQGDWFTSP